MLAQWMQLSGTLFGTLLGGGLVILANYLNSRRQETIEITRRQLRNRAVYTGVYAIRNFVAAALNDFEQNGPLIGPLTTRQSVESSLRTLNRLIDKVSPDDQSLTISIYDLALKLDALAAALNSALELDAERHLRMRINDVLGALEQFDIMSSSDLQFMSEDDLKRFGYDPGSETALQRSGMREESG